MVLGEGRGTAVVEGCSRDADVSAEQLKEWLHRADVDAGCRAKVIHFARTRACRVSRWQRVIHGDTDDLRSRVVEAHLAAGRYRRAVRFALCGRGDYAMATADLSDVKVRSRGCNDPCCPRCSRKRGGAVLGRMSRVLSQRAHGAMYHVVLTQHGRRAESLADARARFERKWKRVRSEMSSCGAVGGLLTFHVKLSSAGWWHYHAHLVLEMDGDGSAGVDRLAERWWDLTNGEEGNSTTSPPVFRRRVCGPGPALHTDFGQVAGLWGEAEDPVARVIQYVVADVCQGVERWIGSETDDETVKEWVETVASAKLRRLLGAWRKEVPVDDGANDTSTSGTASGTKPEMSAQGSMDSVLSRAASGSWKDLMILRRLESSFSNRSLVGRRFLDACRSVG